MTKMAIPMRTEPQFRTPSKKRQRVEEIDDSYTSSRIGSSSPILNPGRSPKRIVLPDDMRRRSDPGFISPYKANTPRRRRLEEDFSAISLKQEQQVGNSLFYSGANSGCYRTPFSLGWIKSSKTYICNIPMIDLSRMMKI